MKKILLLSSVFASVMFFGKPANAQFHASINIGVQPAWGPSGYDYAENYYLPDVEAYYSVDRRQFVYNDGGRWVYSTSLPGRCSNYDLYSGYKVVLNERDPWAHFNNHRMQYANYRSRHDQVVIRDYRNNGRGSYGRPFYDDRSRGRDWGNNNRRDDRDRRQDRSYDNDRRQDRSYDNDRRHDNDHGDRGRGRW